jgi:hypothetical protein
VAEWCEDGDKPSDYIKGSVKYLSLFTSYAFVAVIIKITWTDYVMLCYFMLHLVTEAM